MSARYIDRSAILADEDQIITNGVTSNLRRAFPLPTDRSSADDRFAVLLEALKRVSSESD